MVKTMSMATGDNQNQVAQALATLAGILSSSSNQQHGGLWELQLLVEAW